VLHLNNIRNSGTSNMPIKNSIIIPLFKSIFFIGLLKCSPLENDISYKKNPNKNNLKILVLGNSITGAPAAPTDWSNVWGMAASAPQNDYVHILHDYFTDTLKYKPQIIAVSLTAFEHDFPSFDFSSLDSIKTLNADLIVFRIGDNVKDDMAVKDHFWEKFEALLDYFCINDSQVIICTSSWFTNRSVNTMMKAVCRKKNILFVDISPLFIDKSNRASSERYIKDAGVGKHPGDRGMKKIADLLWNTIVRML
jgi:hypothetical protein